jgi:hypothetical protein
VPLPIITGAIITGATVTVTNISMNVSQMYTTGGDGSFFFPNLPITAYLVKIEKPGFSSEGDMH